MAARLETQFFTIVALVVTLSGVAFTFILTVRQLTAKTVNGWLEIANTYRDAVNRGHSKSMKRQATVGYWKLHFWHALWYVSLIAPILFLAVYAWVSSSKVLEAYYSANKQPVAADTAKEGSEILVPHPRATNLMNDEWYADCIDCQMWWLFYMKWLSFGAVALTAISIPGARFGLWLISNANNSIVESQGISPREK